MSASGVDSIDSLDFLWSLSSSRGFIGSIMEFFQIQVETHLFIFEMKTMKNSRNAR